MNKSECSDEERPLKRRKAQGETTTSNFVSAHTFARSTEQDAGSAAPVHETVPPSHIASLLRPQVWHSGNVYRSINVADHATVLLGDVYNIDSSTALRPNLEATFEAFRQAHKPCHPGTRVELLNKIREWAQDSDGKSIFWLNGMAGTGKSTVAFTVAQWLDQQRAPGCTRLGASFFFKRGDGDRASAALFFPTIAYQLQKKIPGLERLIDEAVTADPTICTQAIQRQFHKLICEPLQKLGSNQQQFMHIIVVDALDECDNESDIEDLLKLWPYLFSMISVGLRLFLTSRPESLISLGFSRMPASAHQGVILHIVEPKIIEHDILVYLKDTFQSIRDQYNREPLSGVLLPDSWPGDTILQRLVHLAAPLFIVAATICRFVQDPNFDPQKQLDTILKSRKTGYPCHVAEIYLPILQQVGSSCPDVVRRRQVYEEFELIVGTVVVLGEPLSRTALADLLQVPPTTIFLRLRSLRSVIDVPLDADHPIRPLHLSFGEFLTSQECQGLPFRIDTTTIHDTLSTRCLAILSKPASIGLCKDMCQVNELGLTRNQLDTKTVEERLPPAFSYACRYWADHLQQSRADLEDNDHVHKFLQLHLLHWIEAMVLLDQAGQVQYSLGLLQTAAKRSPHDTTDLSAFLADAQRFYDTNREIVGEFPLQLYSSAVIFSTPGSVINDLYGEIPTWLEQCTSLLNHFDDEGRSLSWSVTYSPDGALVAAEALNTVRIWNAETGLAQHLITIPCRSIRRLSISPDNSTFVALTDHSSWVCRFEGSQTVLALEQFHGYAYSTAFSQDSSHLALGLSSGNVRLWNVATDQTDYMLEGHRDQVHKVAFSPSGSVLASASFDNTMRLWCTATGRLIHLLNAHGDLLTAISFSPNSTFVAASCVNRIIYVWDVRTGEAYRQLNGHDGSVDDVLFSPCGSTIISASFDKTIRLWDLKIGLETQQFEYYDFTTTLALTTDGQHILTSRASFPITDRASFVGVTADLASSAAFTIRKGWLYRAGKRFLHLPFETAYRTAAIYGNQIAVTRPNGHVVFLKIRCP